MTDIVPVPAGIHSTEFPTNADRTAGTFNPKVVAWGDSTRAQSVRDREIALTAYTNAVAAYEAALAAGESKDQAAAAALSAFNEAARSQIEANRSEAGAASAWAAAAAAGSAAGLPSLVGKAGQALVVLPDETGVGWAVLNTRGSQDYTASASINKSMFGNATFVLVELWGGAASGGAAAGPTGSTVAQPPGGEGGSYNAKVFRIADLAAVTPLTIGAGGAAVSATSSGTATLTRGIAGGNSSFSGFTVYGGLSSSAASPEIPSSNSAGGSNGGAGGGIAAQTFSVDANARLVTGQGGQSSLGGGGGGGGTVDGNLRNGGVATNAGSGGAGLSATATGQAATSGVAPSGGGGGARLLLSGSVTVTSGAGARGQARLTWW